MSRSPQSPHFQVPLRDQEGWYKSHFEASTGVPATPWSTDKTIEVQVGSETAEVDLEDGSCHIKPSGATAVSSFLPQNSPPEAQIDGEEGPYLEPKPECEDRPSDALDLQKIYLHSDPHVCLVDAPKENIGVAKAKLEAKLKIETAESTLRGQSEFLHNSIETTMGKPMQPLQDGNRAFENVDSKSPRLIALKNFVLSEFLFRAGTLSYLLFVVKMLRKIWTMFQNQFAVAVGHLVVSVGLFIVIQYWGTKPVEIQAVGQRSRFSRIIVDITVLAGAFICTSIVWQLVSVIGGSVVKILRMYF
ncbi:hypothetical protein F5879DRAFT_992470 [Lentinula edodes]|uniref:uncharacterized protein n=1 Tax=Lentinula edodes TaxID=5353 RepID=UPI001E8E0F5B|nr:uncharacterized protein C8R40DRAFT_1075022 [Lentinula edodes]KAH7868163.1 hypothetical protein C8R40DRAFT_1075022 [Lentinula edodes]KAJ3900864.1 hypothetical protein F5879DRAFT_992470 [Lentinula edodes]